MIQEDYRVKKEFPRLIPMVLEAIEEKGEISLQLENRIKKK
jgi:hypothetical protein